MPILNLIVQIVAIISVLIAAGSILAGIQMARRQMNIQAFTAYAARFEAIMSDFPNHAYSLRFCLTEHLPPSSEELSLCVLRYLNLSSEEFYLQRAQYLDKKLWQIWEKEIKRTLASPLVIREWPRLLSEFEEYPEFIRFVQSAQVNRQPPPAFVVSSEYE